ncbi:probable ATP-dependent RNA helicase DDX10 [Acanthaster planci]|uniref:ATP-dependent RNA helicase n=1 Tax=Acanthaster planci TaxID=133434 RepID=A0A8B7YC41_ACAPL|nr:probable ATP-dependent RNA helicase DDX10 [Acanthaster planci]
MAQRTRGKNPQPRGKKSKRFHHTSDQVRHKLEVKRWQLEEEEGKRLQSQYESIDPENINSFADLPLSVKTQTGLCSANYRTPTEIQRATVGLALQGHDILGAAKTGSGKTLAFLIPVLECLYRSRWSRVDGLGALIISPTRELAYQTFEVLCKVGKKHDFSAGLIIGGKDLKSEMERISRTNIVVCTPGRFLQHLDQTVCLDCSNLQILVLDEADRILDLGFEKTMNAILESLPTERQTLLFSATQTKSVRDLARLSLKDPKYVAVHQHHEYSTPAQLEQSYVVCELDQKMDLLYSFIRNHTQQKILVFMASCKQVKYTFEVFCALHPGITIMALYGTLHQLRRVAIYNEFCQRDYAVLFATDIAARGLDFPAVNWVVQLDCPEDASTYIHRVGRTARYERGGESLLILLPSEEAAMKEQLEERKIPIQKINVNPNRKLSIQKKLMSLCAGSHELKQSAQRCFINYVKSVYLMKNKSVFDVNQLPLERYSFSLGLAIPPRVRFLQRANKRKEEREMLKRRKSSEHLQHQEDESRDAEVTNRKAVPMQHRQGADLVMEEEQDETGGGEDGGLDALVAKLRSTVPNRAKGGGNIKPRRSQGEERLEEAEIERMKRHQEDAKIGHDDEDAEESEESEEVTRMPSPSQEIALPRTQRVIPEDRLRTPAKSSKTKKATESMSRTSEQQSNSESASESEASLGEASQMEFRMPGETETETETRDEDDKDEDFLVVKKKDVFGITEEKPKQRDPTSETIEGAKHVGNSKKKPLTRVATAKKLRRMKIAVNTKKIFDEEGEIAQQWPPIQSTVVPGDDQPAEGGIDIEKAKMWMREEDQHDKRAFRERIRAKHKAERLKAKEERRKYARRRKGEDSDDEDVGASLDLGEDYVPFDPDTLPDPDKYADENGGTDNEEKQPQKKVTKKKTKIDKSSVETTKKRKAKLERDGQMTVKKKRKPAGKGEGPRVREEAESQDTGLMLQDDEELALHILSSSQF